MKPILLITIFLFIPLLTKAAAPNDISNNQRAWYDAVDVNANNNYADNPANNSAISQWSDKSGTGNHVTASGTTRPLYRQNTIATQRHGIDFDGSDDTLRRTVDIWASPGTPVSQSEVFLVATTDVKQTSTVFSSTDGSSRIIVHLPWDNNEIYYDHGFCCDNPGRVLILGTSIATSTQYFWNFIGSPSEHSIVQDGDTLASNNSAGVYTNPTNASFALGGWAQDNSAPHDGRLFEAIFYQTSLNRAQRRILSSYLSAKWDRAFASGADYTDVYSGDNSANGNYDFFVGGIGQDSGTQSSGTSQGLTISNNTFLTGNGKFILAGVNYLVTTPPTGTTTTDLPSAYSQRSNRSWYIDTTGSGGLANLSFNANTIGIPVDNGAQYGLLHRSGTSGAFTEVATATMSGGAISFSHLPADGVYTVGKLGDVVMNLQKTSLVAQDPVNNTNNPKAIPGAFVDYTLTVKNTGDGNPDADTTAISDNINDRLDLFTGDLDGSGSPFVFTDNSCPPETNTLSSNLTLDYPADVVFQDTGGSTVTTPGSGFNTAIKSFKITLSGIMNTSSGGSTPCFTLKYRAKLK